MPACRGSALYAAPSSIRESSFEQIVLAADDASALEPPLGFVERRWSLAQDVPPTSSSHLQFKKFSKLNLKLNFIVVINVHLQIHYDSKLNFLDVQF